MVRIVTINNIFDNGTLDMAQNLMSASDGWSENYENFVLCFQNSEHFCNRSELKQHFSMETLEKWEESNQIVFPKIMIDKLTIYRDTFNEYGDTHECLVIEIYSDNDKAIEDIFKLMGGLGNGGHSFGGIIKYKENTNIWFARFGFDGDGCDRIYYVNDKYIG